MGAFPRLWGILFLCALATAPAGGQSSGADPVITRIPPGPRGGVAYRLEYRVEVPLAAFWRFKTDFDNPALTTHRYILTHRLLHREPGRAVTENHYTYAPDLAFRWETTLDEAEGRLAFTLINPDQCGQRFNYGHIQLLAEGDATRVVHFAHFDFWGASVWAAFPGPGGMKAFLSYTARWEQRVALTHRSLDPPPPSRGPASP